MSAPWERYRSNPSPAASSGPWARYRSGAGVDAASGGEASVQARRPPPALPTYTAVSEAIDSTAQQYGAGRDAPVPRREPEPLSSLFRMDSDFKKRSGVSAWDMLTAAAKDTFGSSDGAAEYLAGKSKRGLSALMGAGARVEHGASGEPLVRLEDGTRYRLNDPGADTTDLARVAGNVAALWSPASWINRLNQAKNFGRLASAGTQGLGMASADAALQAGFNGGRVDPVRTGLAGLGGSAGEVIGPVIGRAAEHGVKFARNLVGVVDRGKNAQEFATALGLESPTPEQLARLSAGLDEIANGADPRTVLGSERFGFVYTQAQRTADTARKADLWAQEEWLRQQPATGGLFARLDEVNAGQRGQATQDIAARFGSQPGATPTELMTTAQRRVLAGADDLKGRIDDAYATAGQSERAAVGVDSVRGVPLRLKKALAEFDVNPKTMPATARTLEQVRSTAALMPKGTKGVTLRALEAQRRIINHNFDAATNKADREAMRRLKVEYDSWMDDAMDDALISGDPQALTVLKEARGLRAEFGRRFEGNDRVDRFVQDLLEEGARTPEELLNLALGAGQVSRESGGRFIERLRVATNNDAETLNALRAAHFLRMTTGKNGEVLGPQAITQNVARMQFQNPSVIRSLYTDAEWREVVEFAKALKPMLPPANFARTSGSGERVTRMLTQQAIGRAPLIGWIARGVEGMRTAIQTNRAISGSVRPPLRRSHEGAAAMGPVTAEAWDQASTR